MWSAGPARNEHTICAASVASERPAHERRAQGLDYAMEICDYIRGFETYQVHCCGLLQPKRSKSLVRLLACTSAALHPSCIHLRSKPYSPCSKEQRAHYCIVIHLQCASFAKVNSRSSELAATSRASVYKRVVRDIRAFKQSWPR
jgi:hypothetical protein